MNINLSKKQLFTLVFLFFVIIGLAIYSNSFNNEFFWDDDDVIVNNVYTHDLSQLPKYFSENLISGTGQKSNYWRPLLLTSFSIDYQIWGFNPLGYHLNNTFFHILSAFLGFILFYKLTNKRFLLSFLPTLFFLIHPLQTEAVTYMAGRADPLSTVFSLAALVLYTYFRERKKYIYLYLSLALFILGLMVKEQVIFLPALVLLIETIFYLSRKNIKKSIISLTPYFLISIIYFILRITVSNFNQLLSGTTYNSLYDGSIWVRIYTFCLVIWKYFKFIFIPQNLHMVPEVNIITNFFSWPVLGLIFFLILIFYIAYKIYNENKYFAFGFLWFFIILAPRTNIISINRPMYEHWLYLPILGFYLALFSLLFFIINKIKDRKMKKYIFYTFFIIVFLYISYLSYLTIVRNKLWHDPITFYEYNLKYTPNSFIQHNNLGMALADKGEHEEANQHYQRALSINDDYPQVYSNYANSLLALNKLEEAKRNYLKAIDISPKFSIPYQKLLIIYTRQDKQEKIKELFNRFKDNFNYTNYYLNFKLSYYLQTNQNSKALNLAQELNKIEPDNRALQQLIFQLKVNNLSR
ncbi:tetratricopeptide repeat protein [Patescibacteria group bacterium]|nr:tetratricopeptide repeat protein [Patescibacteria group bacterium]